MIEICQDLNRMFCYGRVVFLWDDEYQTVAVDCDAMANVADLRILESKPGRFSEFNPISSPSESTDDGQDGAVFGNHVSSSLGRKTYHPLNLQAEFDNALRKANLAYENEI